MTDPAPVDMAPFLASHDRMTRLTFVVTATVSLAVSVGSIAFGAFATGAARPIGADLWLPMVLIPLFLIAFQVATMRWGRKRPTLPDGSLLMNPDDARGARRVASAGGIFVAGIAVAMIATQANVALDYFGILASLGNAGEWLGRAGLAATGGLMVYFGNVWPRMPTARAPGQKPAVQQKFNRLYGWMVVTTGLLFALASLLPLPAMAIAVGILGLGLTLAVTAAIVWYYRAMKSPSAR